MSAKATKAAKRSATPSPRTIARRVSRVLEGGGEWHRKAEARRNDICLSIHWWTNRRIAPMTMMEALNDLAQCYGISPSTVRSIHRQRCRRTPKVAR